MAQTASFKILEVKGNAYERGVQQGEILRDHHEPMMDAFFESELWKDHKPKLVGNDLAKWAFRLIGTGITKNQVRQNLPVQRERIRGIAKGLGVDEPLVWGIHFLEIMFCEAGASLAIPGGCTQLHATGEATKDGRPLVGRNYDFPNMLLDYQIIRTEYPTEKGRLASITAGHIPLAGTHNGVNEAGLVVVCNNARLWRGQDFQYRGVPYQLIAQEILETCRTTEEAVAYISRFKARANAGFMGFMDEKGHNRVAEFTASRISIREPEDSGVQAQTNHFQKMTEANLPDGTFWTVAGMEGLEYARSTKDRLKVSQEGLRKAAGKITEKTLISILSDHGKDGVGSDYTVCSHGKSGGTLSAYIVDPVNRTLWAACGYPCEAKFEKFELKSTAKVSKPKAARKPAVKKVVTTKKKVSAG